jgi:hypothetical protein
LHVPEHIEAAQHTCDCEVVLSLTNQGHRVRGGRWRRDEIKTETAGSQQGISGWCQQRNCPDGVLDHFVR